MQNSDGYSGQTGNTPSIPSSLSTYPSSGAARWSRVSLHRRLVQCCCLQRIRRTALRQASAFIVAKGNDGNYKALLFDLTGRVDSAATAELVGAAVAGAAGTGHKTQVTDCKSFLAIEARAKTTRPLRFSTCPNLQSCNTHYLVASGPPGQAGCTVVGG